MVTISFELPEDIENQLKMELADLSATAKEAVLVELFRHGKLSHGKFAECLGISRYQADAVLKRYGVTEDLPTLAEFDDQLASLPGPNTT